MNFFRQKPQVNPLSLSYQGNDTTGLYQVVKELAKSVEDGIIPVYERKISEFVDIVVQFKANYWVAAWLLELAKSKDFSKSERLAAGLAAREIEQLEKEGRTDWMRIDGLTSKRVAADPTPNLPHAPQVPQSAPDSKQETQRINPFAQP